MLFMLRGVSRKIRMTYPMILCLDLMCTDSAHHAAAKDWDMDGCVPCFDPQVQLGPRQRRFRSTAPRPSMEIQRATAEVGM